MDVFLMVGLPFLAFLIPVAWAAYGIGGSGSDPLAMQAEPTGRVRIRRAALVLVAGLVTGLGAASAASAHAFGRTTDAGLAVEPAALLFTLEAVVDLVLIAVVALPGWSNRRAWALRMAGVYWLCLAAPAWILADAGPGWISTGSDGIYALGLPAFIWETVAALVPPLLLWLAARGGYAPDDAGSSAVE
ncbi:MAG TPA: hypothetical protein VF337_09500 [Candidatus Limnocylindrales bacterium]